MVANAKKKVETCLRTPEKADALIPHQNRREYARRAQIDYDRLNRWLNGTGGLGYQQLWRLAQQLGKTTDWLLDDSQGIEIIQQANLEKGRFTRSRTKPRP